MKRKIKRMLILCNKQWEFAAFSNALLYRFIAPLNLNEIIISDLEKKTCNYFIENINLEIEISCLQNYLDSESLETNSKQKYNALENIFKSEFDFCISIGTGTCDVHEIQNGSVLVGSDTCVYNPFKNSTDENMLLKEEFKNITTSKVTEKLGLGDESFELILKNALLSPNKGGNKRFFEVSKNIVALSVTNIVNFEDYSWADIEAVKEIKQYHNGLNKLSLDTTHGIIRWFANEKFLFFTGITNRIGQYKIDFEPNYYTQGYVAAFNCGIVFKVLFQDLIKLI